MRAVRGHRRQCDYCSNQAEDTSNCCSECSEKFKLEEELNNALGAVMALEDLVKLLEPTNTMEHHIKGALSNIHTVLEHLMKKENERDSR